MKKKTTKTNKLNHYLAKSPIMNYIKQKDKQVELNSSAHCIPLVLFLWTMDLYSKLHEKQISIKLLFTV